MDLHEFNAASEHDATQVLLACADVPSWASALVEARPYADAAALTTKAEQLAARWTSTEVDAALGSHPRIGERRTQDDAAARLSRQEQAGLSADETVRAELRAANAAYEERFDRIFLIRAAGRDEREILAEARRRLANDDAAEAAEVAEQLRQITMLRLSDAISDDAAPSGSASSTSATSPMPATATTPATAMRSTVTTHVLDAVSGTPAAGVTVTLAVDDPTATNVFATDSTEAGVIATGITDDDGRISRLGPSDLAPGTYTLTFATGDWFAARDVDSFYPRVTITFTLTPEREHVHVPILLSPFAYSTYRGS